MAPLSLGVGLGPAPPPHSPGTRCSPAGSGTVRPRCRLSGACPTLAAHGLVPGEEDQGHRRCWPRPGEEQAAGRLRAGRERVSRWPRLRQRGTRTWGSDSGAGRGGTRLGARSQMKPPPGGLATGPHTPQRALHDPTHCAPPRGRRVHPRPAAVQAAPTGRKSGTPGPLPGFDQFAGAAHGTARSRLTHEVVGLL